MAANGQAGAPPAGGSLPSSPSAPLPQSTLANIIASGPLPPPLPPRDSEPAAGGAGWWGRFKAAVKRVKKDVVALHYASQDPRTGLLPRLVVLLAVAYAVSPIDLIPDFIPVLGLVDDLLILPGLILLAVWLIPHEVMEAAHQRAEYEPLRLHKAWGMAAFFFLVWDALLLWALWWALGHFGGEQLLAARPWIVAGCGVLLAAGELAWVLAGRRREEALGAVLDEAGVSPDLQQALLAGGSRVVREYLEP